MTLTDLGRIQKGMTTNEVDASLPKAPRHVWRPIIPELAGSAEVRHYVVASGGAKSDYLLAFVDGQLYFWGYPHEFARSKEPLVNAIGRAAVAALSGNQPGSQRAP
jgi:hypothetical protein